MMSWGSQQLGRDLGDEPGIEVAMVAVGAVEVEYVRLGHQAVAAGIVVDVVARAEALCSRRFEQVDDHALIGAPLIHRQSLGLAAAKDMLDAIERQLTLAAVEAGRRSLGESLR